MPLAIAFGLFHDYFCLMHSSIFVGTSIAFRGSHSSAPFNHCVLRGLGCRVPDLPGKTALPVSDGDVVQRDNQQREISSPCVWDVEC